VKNNKLSLGILFALVLVLSLAISACGYESSRSDQVVHIPHASDIRFENCLVCHTGGNVPAGGPILGVLHENYALESCTMPACHPSEPVAPKPTTTPPVTTDPTTTPPTSDPTTGPTTDPTTEPTTEPTTPPSGDAPQLSADNHVGQTNDALCSLCHPAPYPNPDDANHQGVTSGCLADGCHTLP
jgi:hypothetical protein